MSRNWVRAASCLIGPIAAVLIVQTVAKPLVGRQFEGTLSYPSGTVTAVAALAAVAFLLVPRFAKPLVAVAGGVVVAAVCAAVVALRWHYPTDAFGGLCVGVGVVFVVDGLLMLIRNRYPVRPHS
jgi:membrane-associated phospholipid phosphatase